MITSVDDGLYGVSLGGNLVMNLVSRVPVHAAIVGAPAVMWFLGIRMPPPGSPPNPDAFRNLKPDPEISSKNIEPIRTPVLILVGTADRLMPVAVMLHDALAAAGKSVRLDIYEGGYHDFCLGPQGQKRPDLPQGEALFDSALDALEKPVLFTAGKLK